tara:strand:+ start:354 stop:1004 length:651 start_codon:yes stop_codon:yes gene_type:complete
MKNILAIGAHPDDVEFGCFGTLKKHINEGDKVFICLMSNSTVKDAFSGKLTRTRKNSIIEAQQSANFIGASLIMLDFQDTQIPFNSKTVASIEKIIHKNKINTIYTHWGGDTHQDHINTLNSTLAASRMVENVFCYEQVPLPRVCVNYPVANYYVNISNTLDDKIKSCTYHHSQLKKYSNMKIDILDNIKTLAKYRGNQSNTPYAEAFNALKIVVN